MAGGPSTPEPQAWTRSSYSGQQGNCVETRRTEYAVLIRDSKDSEGPALAVSGDAWAAFVDFATQYEV